MYLINNLCECLYLFMYNNYEFKIIERTNSSESFITYYLSDEE